MSMKAKYRPQDYEARLHGGVVLWGNVPHRIQCDGGALSIHDLVTGEAVARRIDGLHENLDISSLQLGYLNGLDGAYYLERIPARKFKQAVDARVVSEYKLTAGGFILRHGEGNSEYLMTEHFRDTYTKRFPTFEEACLRLKNPRVSSVALSRDIAITSDEMGIVKVWWKINENPIGWVGPGTRKVIVPESDKAWIVSMYLSELDWEVE